MYIRSCGAATHVNTATDAQRPSMVDRIPENIPSTQKRFCHSFTSSLDNIPVTNKNAQSNNVLTRFLSPESTPLIGCPPSKEA
ncbi:uncharacterized protein BKA55DRAFT_562024 [Fusarium redolens]|uniref:Uncharacterized protein n=1 Tax=Fusarium redolens TaxID=48865 RepID=A0A9P9HK59_FUSRE|nr:uncharacterized protein BKA55DRAFT_562024 [Fusarium redolens]KAH7259075.1 hypothetical protein BKA55DRAFT_562024 [Fusarium redolens]